MVKKVIINLDLSKASGPNCIPVVVLRSCEPELYYLLAELFNKYLKGFSFPDCWKVSSVVPVFKNLGERSTAKNYRPVSLLSVVSKVFEKLVNKRIVDHPEKCGFFLGILELWHLIYPRLLTGFCMLIFFTNVKEFQVIYLALFLLFSVIDGFEWFWMESLNRVSS